MSVFPNPANKELSILLPDYFTGEVKLSIVDVNGTTEKYFTLPAGQQLKADLHDLSAGIYFLKAFDEKGQFEEIKFIVQ